MKLRKLFAGVAAAATLLGGLAFGTTANAADPTNVVNGIVQDNATFTFTAEDANQWGSGNNRTIKAYKIGDYKQNGAAGSYYYTLATPTTPGTAKTTLTNALNAALKGAGANGADVTVPIDANTDPLAWAVENKYLDASGTKPYAEGTTRALADALQAAEKDKADDQADFAVTTLTKGNGLAAVGTDGKSYTASLSAGLYLFLDTTGVTNNHVADGEAKDQNSANATQKQGGVIVNSAAMIVASGTLVTTESDLNYGKITDPVNGDNTVNLKNHVTPVAKSHDDKDNTVSEGQEVGYTLTTTIPAFTTGYKDYTFALADTPGAGQTVDLSNLKVYVDGETDNDEVKPYDATNNPTGYELTTPDNYDATTKTFVAGNNKSFSVDLTKFVQARQYDSKESGAVKVTYAATITSKKDPVTNKVQVQDNGNDNHAEDSTNLSTGGFSFTKVDADGNAVKTKDAKFKITAVAPTDANATAVAETPTTDTATSDENGKVTFEGLADGTYTVEETGVPEGFLGHTTDGSAPSVAAKFEVTIKGGKAVYFKHGDNWGLTKDSADNTQSGTEITDYTVKNVKSITQLPLTGAAGIGLFTVVALLLAGAGVTVFAKSRSTKRALRA